MPILQLLGMIAAFGAAIGTWQNTRALYKLKKSEVDLSLRRERKEYFQKIENILSELSSSSVEGYMHNREFFQEIKKIKILERKICHVLYKYHKKIFLEISESILNIFRDYHEVYKNNTTKPQNFNINHAHLIQEALKKLEILENNYLCVENFISFNGSVK